jgi:hypothetical protein
VNNPLIEISQFVEKEAKASRVAVIFDLDSTLFCVAPRTQAILRELGGQAEFAGKFQEASEILRNVEVLPTDWGIRAVMQRQKFTPTEELIMAVRDFWRRNFFANHFLDRDTIYPSANEYVRHLHQLGAQILYLTGREEKLMSEGTRKMLAHWGFPFFEDSKLYMKPSDVETDESFKAVTLKRISTDFDHIWFFENEPVIIDLVREMVPQVRIVFVNSVHSGRATPPADLPTIGMSYTSGLPGAVKKS